MIRSLLALALPALALGYLGIDVSQRNYQSTFSCAVNNGYHFAIIRVYQSFGQPDPNGPANINDAWNGGMSYVDGYIFPCYSCGNAAGQMRDTVNYLASRNVRVARQGESVKNPGNVTEGLGATVGMLWIDVEGTSYWSTNQGSNVAFIQEMVSEGQRLGVSLGIYSSYYQWNPITGNTGQFSYLPLWYAHYDNNPSFSDWYNFGGWTKPAIKQYAGDVGLCGVNVDKNYY